MRHAFWPRNICTGTITTKDGPIDFQGKALFIHALQGMKPHHAAAKWNFVDLQGPNFSAIMMEYTTPPSYGTTVVNVGGLIKDDQIITAGSSNSAAHSQIKGDPENDWPEPEAVKFEWKGTTKDGKPVYAKLEGPLGERLDRVDVMAEVPGFIKKIVAGAAGTKPYIYQVRIHHPSHQVDYINSDRTQYSPHETKVVLKVKIGDEEEVVEEGRLFTEATFISA